MQKAKLKADVAFEMFSLLGAPYYCFHDADARPEGQTFAESTKNLNEIVDYLQRELGIKPGEISADGQYSLEEVECLGHCGTAPVVQINGEFYENMNVEKLTDLLATLK